MQNSPESRVFLDIFDGGHEMHMDTAMQWFLSQYGNGCGIIKQRKIYRDKYH